MDQAVPFHRSASVTSPPILSLKCWPTAVHAERLEQETAEKAPSGARGFTVGSSDHPAFVWASSDLTATVGSETSSRATDTMRPRDREWSYAEGTRSSIVHRVNWVMPGAVAGEHPASMARGARLGLIALPRQTRSTYWSSSMRTSHPIWSCCRIRYTPTYSQGWWHYRSRQRRRRSRHMSTVADRKPCSH
jgi:hypothetical protein